MKPAVFSRPFGAAILFASALLLAGCGGNDKAAPPAAKGPIKFEAACDLAGVDKPARQTAILIDEGSIVRAGPAEFRTKNPGVIDTVIAVADPVQAVQLGALAPRERVSLLVTPVDGSAPQLMFTGCAPAMTAEELAQFNRGSSAVARASDSFFASGKADEIKQQSEDFRARLLGAIQRVAQAAPEKPARAAESFEASPPVRSLKAAARLLDPLAGVPRIVMIAPAALRSVPRAGSPAAARQAGFDAAARAGLDLGMAEVAMALVAPGADRDFIDAFLLGSRARLTGWSSGAPTDLSSPPTSVRNFAGTIQYGGTTQFPIRARIAVDGEGRLANSWVLVMNEEERATPLSGSAVCDENGDCRVTGDGSGFAQLWSLKPGGEPEFEARCRFRGCATSSSQSIAAVSRVGSSIRSWTRWATARICVFRWPK
jgi:hypothetical protein